MKKSLTQIRDENEGAFTLVELLVVILIIGILAAIAIPAFLNQRKAAVDSSVQSDVKNAATQVETWMASNPAGSVPNINVTSAGVQWGTTPTAQRAAVLNQIKVSDGTTLSISSGAGTVGTYKIEGVNEGGDKARNDDGTEGIIYLSNSGGLQK